MLRVGDVLDLGPLGMKFSIKKTAAETNGQSFDMELQLNAHRDAGVIHIHPHAIESYEVLQDKFDVYINGDWKTLSVGEKAVVDRVFHTPSAIAGTKRPESTMCINPRCGLTSSLRVCTSWQIVV